MAENQRPTPKTSESSDEQWASAQSAAGGEPPHFLDRYTSATADLSAGGVAEALYADDAEADLGRRDPGSEALPTSPTYNPPAAGPTVSDTAAWTDARPRAVAAPATATTPPRAETFTPRSTSTYEPGMQDVHTHDHDRRVSRGVIFGVSGGTLLTLGSAIGAAYWYSRWQRERNRPINRLRRRARGLSKRTSELAGRTGELAERLQEREVAAPVGAGSAAVLLTLLALLRTLRSGSRDETDAAASESAATTLASARETRDLAIDALLARLRDLKWSELKLNDVLADLADAAASRAAAAGQAASQAAASAQAAREEMPAIEVTTPSKAQAGGLGAGLVGLGVVGAAGYLVWRMLRGDGQQADWGGTAWSTGTSTPNGSPSTSNGPDAGNAPNQ